MKLKLIAIALLSAGLAACGAEDAGSATKNKTSKTSSQTNQSGETADQGPVNLAKDARVLKMSYGTTEIAEHSPSGHLIDGDENTKIMVIGNHGMVQPGPPGQGSMFIPTTQRLFVYFGENTPPSVKRIVIKGKIPYRGYGNFPKNAYPLIIKPYFEPVVSDGDNFDLAAQTQGNTDDSYEKNWLVHPEFTPYKNDCTATANAGKPACEYVCETYTVTPASLANEATGDAPKLVDQIECVLNKPVATKAFALISNSPDVWMKNGPTGQDFSESYISEFELYSE